MSVAVRLLEDSEVDDDYHEMLLGDRILAEVAAGAESSWTLPVKVRARGGVVQLVVTVRAYKASEVTA